MQSCKSCKWDPWKEIDKKRKAAERLSNQMKEDKCLEWVDVVACINIDGQIVAMNLFILLCWFDLESRVVKLCAQCAKISMYFSFRLTITSVEVLHVYWQKFTMFTKHHRAHHRQRELDHSKIEN